MKSFILITLILLYSIVHIHSHDIFTNPVTAKGQILQIEGRVLNRSGQPIPDLSVEIWQTDEQGIYDHPGDRDSNNRDRGFQFFGTSISNASGEYQFRTIIPGKYEPRPRHIHVKIRNAERIILVTQIYFSMDGDTAGVGGSNKNLRMDIRPSNSDNGTIEYLGIFDFVINMGVSGNLRLTDRQSEGPYYPRANVSLFDNDLAHVSH